MKYIYLHYDSIVRSLKEEMTRIRTGRVQPSLVENLKLEAYGTTMTIMELASVNSTEARTLVITPYDKNLISPISKAIEEARLGVNPIDNGAGVILNFPQMTEENRKAQLKVIDEIQETIKIMIRQQRLEIINKTEREMEGQNASLDVIKGFKADLQNEVDALNAEIEQICKLKKEEVLKI